MKRTDSEYIKFILSETNVEDSEFYTLPPDSNDQFVNEDGIPYVIT